MRHEYSLIDECDDERLNQLLEGALDQADTDLLEQHIETCRCCERRLSEQAAAAGFWEDTKRFLGSVAELPVLRDEEDDGIADATYCRDIPLQPTDDPLMLGRFGGYEIRGVIGRGGMGVVLKGWDVSLDRFVAIKVLSPTLAHQSAARKRFAREAKASAAVVHDNMVPIHCVDQCEGLPFLVMPYIKGESLQRRIDREAPLPLDSILEISLQIARGLQAAHDLGLVHRDIKPANILLPQSVSRVMITDFGLARAADDATLTRSGMIAGTPAYMSPEQARGEDVDGRTDLFSLGSVIYAMACGHPPFRADTSYGVLRRITDNRHRSLAQVQSVVPRWFEAIVDRLLEKNPSQRFQSAEALAVHLEGCLSHLRQPMQSPPPKLSRSTNRKFTWTLAIALVTATATTIGAMLTWTAFQTTDNSAAQSDLEILQKLSLWDEQRDEQLDRLETLLDELKRETSE